jgi:drug/metabolite transporter (DMT)-like permease
MSFPHATDLRRAAVLMMLSSLAFATMGAAIKIASQEAGNAMVVFFRNAVGLVALLPWAFSAGRAGLVTHELPGHLLRGLAGLAAMSCFFFAIGHLRLADAVVLNQSFPLFLPLAERIIAGEPFLPGVWRSLTLGFCGVLLILKPGSGLFTPVALAGVASAVLAATAQVGIRRLTRTEPIERIVFYFGVIATSVSALPLPWLWRTPSPGTLAALVATGVLATIGQLLLTRAYAHAPAAQVGPFVYTGVVFAALADWALWRTLPDAFFVPGALLIAAAGASMLRRRAPRTPASAEPAGIPG